MKIISLIHFALPERALELKLGGFIPSSGAEHDADSNSHHIV
jgi:hypothetical protein